MGGGHDDIFAFGAVLFVGNQKGLGGVMDRDRGDFLHEDHFYAGEQGFIGEIGECATGAVVGGGDGVAKVAVELDAEAGGEDVEVFEFAVVFVVGEEREDAAVVDPGGDGVGVGGLNVIGLMVGGGFLGAGVDDDKDGILVEVLAGGGGGQARDGEPYCSQTFANFE